jgi:pimeloyl-ACP methyl ester carboxylesterase
MVMTRASLQLLEVLLVVFVLSACGAAANDTLVRLPDGRRLHLSCAGRGSPTILLEGGFGATASAWDKVKPLLSGAYRLCSYDRAGYGSSDPGPMPRDGASIAEDLDNALTAARIAGPFVVVGHSAGGLYARLFADRRPREVAGMVLLDPSVEHQDQAFSMFGPNAASLAPIEDAVERCLELAKSGARPSNESERSRCLDRKGRIMPVSLWRTELSELDTLWSATSNEIDEGRPNYGDLPLIVLTADGTNGAVTEPVRSLVDERWRTLHRQIAARSHRGQERVVEGSSHLIMIDKPEAVAQAIREVVAEGWPSPLR